MRPYGQARINARHPEALGVCDRCNFTHNLVDLRWQHQWAGPQLQNLRFLVCNSCMDEPNPQLRTLLIPADPLPVLNPRPDGAVPIPYAGTSVQEVNAMFTEDGLTMITEDGQTMVTEDTLPQLFAGQAGW